MFAKHTQQVMENHTGGIEYLPGSVAVIPSKTLALAPTASCIATMMGSWLTIPNVAASVPTAAGLCQRGVQVRVIERQAAHKRSVKRSCQSNDLKL